MCRKKTKCLFNRDNLSYELKNLDTRLSFLNKIGKIMQVRSEILFLCSKHNFIKTKAKKELHNITS